VTKVTPFEPYFTVTLYLPLHLDGYSGRINLMIFYNSDVLAHNLFQLFQRPL